jgi:hypothetical protein
MLPYSQDNKDHLGWLDEEYPESGESMDEKRPKNWTWMEDLFQQSEGDVALLPNELDSGHGLCFCFVFGFSVRKNSNLLNCACVSAESDGGFSLV